ncbi:uncharacterized protein Z518_02278 [Rhinocladiella mackenziei CBS 650.93]|uniref:Uncharacterized protein n=1 Tax=Rhinocladiella mackenziei CBS 650.93 TaxID=1442369 RepID=A0A0D2JEL5_9EURO|nr:uncharacterized protein Z518_02278 [Rhinocladiella mackenziei CBS 650.93]KIX07625.1 hypothetical protein Z518_02278 [Rhinocladiella mackenziei CBS 650.93]
MQEGTANIFVNDGDMRITSAERAQERRDYYDKHNIGWTVRPKHNPKPCRWSKAAHSSRQVQESLQYEPCVERECLRRRHMHKSASPTFWACRGRACGL